MKCLDCQKPMVASVGDFDYTKLAGLRGKTVTLRDVTTYQCEDCGPKSRFVEIRRMADLTRELVAGGALLVKQLWCVFHDNEWAISFPPSAPKSKSLLDWGPDGLYDDTRAVHLHGRCHASRDGECSWRECPQLKSYKAHCPLDKKTSDED